MTGYTKVELIFKDTGQAVGKPIYVGTTDHDEARHRAFETLDRLARAKARRGLAGLDFTPR